MAQGDAAADVFDRGDDDFASWQAIPWGRLRYSVALATTRRALEGLPGPLRVLDLGGGDGADSLPLAEAGHSVTIVDFAPALLERASSRAGALGVADRVRLVHAGIDDLGGDGAPAGVTAGSFDAVLCHNVLQYRADVISTVRLVVALARPGGVVSVMATNPAMDVLAAAVRRLEPAEALELLDADVVHGGTFDHDMRRLPPGDVEAALLDAGCVVEHRFGIRCVTDLVADDGIKSDPAFFARLEALELALCEREPYWRTARFWQLTGRRAT